MPRPRKPASPFRYFNSSPEVIRLVVMRGFRQWRRHLDEMYVKLNGEMVYLWRAVEQEGGILESYITKIRASVELDTKPTDSVAAAA